MSRGKPISGLTAATTIARWTLRRVARGRALWVAMAFAMLPLLPVLLGGLDGEFSRAWDDFVELCVAILVVLPQLFTAPAIAEEVEDKTFTYLWSRPLPRWSILLGKLMAGVPLTAAMLVVVVLLGYLLLGGGDPAMLARGAAALAAGAAAVGIISAGLGSLVPKHALGVAICYFLVLDLTIGGIPFSLSKLSITHQVRELAGVGNGEGAASALIWAFGVALFWLAIGALRLSRAEFSSSE